MASSRVPDVRVEPDPWLGLVLAGVCPAGERLGEALDGILVVSRYADAGAVGLHAAVDVEHDSTDRKELHDFAREILVRLGLQHRIGLGAALHAEVLAHDGVQRDVTKQRLGVAERVAIEDVEVARRAARRIAHRVVVHRHHEDLRQRVAHTLPQLVAALEVLLPQRRHGDSPRIRQQVRIGLDGVDMRHDRHGELRVEPAVVALRHERVDGVARGAERRLAHEACCVLALVRRRQRGCRDRDSRGRAVECAVVDDQARDVGAGDIGNESGRHRVRAGQDWRRCPAVSRRTSSCRSAHRRWDCCCRRCR